MPIIAPSVADRHQPRRQVFAEQGAGLCNWLQPLRHGRLLYHMLLSSGNFAVYRMESQIFTLFEPRFRPLSKAKNKRRMLDVWYGTRLYKRSDLEPADIEPRIMAECKNGGDFLRILMEEMCRKQGVERWAETTPNIPLYASDQRDYSERSDHSRDPRRSRCRSFVGEAFADSAVPMDRKRAAAAAAIYWEWIVKKGREAGRALGEDYVEVRYEDLVRKPAEVLSGSNPSSSTTWIMGALPKLESGL